MASVAATLYPTAFPVVKVESSHPIDNHEGWRQGSHQQSEGRGGHRKIIGIGIQRGLNKVWSGMVFWNDRVLKPSKDWVKCHCKQEATRWTALSDAPGHEEMSSGFPCKLNLRIAVNIDGL